MRCLFGSSPPNPCLSRLHMRVDSARRAPQVVSISPQAVSLDFEGSSEVVGQ